MSSRRIFLYPPANSPSKGPSHKVSRLRDLSNWDIVRLMRSIVSRIERDRLFMHESLLNQLKRRLQNLAGELVDRIEFLEYLASIDETLSEEEALRLSDEAKPDRKRLAKVPNTPSNGFKKKGFDKKVSNPKNRIWMDRSNIRRGR